MKRSVFEYGHQDLKKPKDYHHESDEGVVYKRRPPKLSDQEMARQKLKNRLFALSDTKVEPSTTTIDYPVQEDLFTRRGGQSTSKEKQSGWGPSCEKTTPDLPSLMGEKGWNLRLDELLPSQRRWYHLFLKENMSRKEARKRCLYMPSNSRPIKRNKQLKTPLGISKIVYIISTSYPKIHLEEEDKLDFENALIQEIIDAPQVIRDKLSFESLEIKDGMMVVTSETMEAADWLRDNYGKISNLPKKEIRVCDDFEREPGYVISVYLPNMEVNGLKDQLAQLLEQNKDLAMEHWLVLEVSQQHRSNGVLYKFGISLLSAEAIKSKDYHISNRLWKSPVWVLKEKPEELIPPPPAPQPPTVKDILEKNALPFIPIDSDSDEDD